MIVCFDSADADHSDMRLNLFKVFHTVFAERTDEISRKFVSLIYISADLAYVAVLLFFYLWLRLRLDVLEVVSVSNGRLFSENLSFCQLGYKERMLFFYPIAIDIVACPHWMA